MHNDSGAAEEARAPFLVGNRTRLGRLLFLLILPGLLFIDHSWPERPWLSFALDWTGWAFVLAGVFMRLWATLYIGGRKQTELQTKGPYSLVRHPLYAGSFLVGLGVSLASENPIMLPVVLIYFGVQYAVTIRYEDAFLARMFGEVHEQWSKRVPCFIPKFSGFDGSGPESVDMRALKRELIRAALFLSMLPLVDLLQRLHASGALPVLLRLP